MWIALDERLQKIADLVRSDVVVCDIGTDHAKLACHIFGNGNVKKVIAADLNDGPLRSAKRTIEANKAYGVDLIKSDGLDNIEYADDVIIAGLGGDVISDIMVRCKFLHHNLRAILQPMTHTEIVRRELYKIGFEIIKETVVQEQEKFYVIIYMKYTGECKDIDEVTAYTGKITNANYVKDLIKTLNKKIAGLSASNSDDDKVQVQEISQLVQEIKKKYIRILV